MIRLVPVTATGDLAASSRAVCSAAASSAASSAKQRLTRLTRSASAPSMVRAVSASSRATPVQRWPRVKADVDGKPLQHVAVPCWTDDIAAEVLPYQGSSCLSKEQCRHRSVP